MKVIIEDVKNSIKGLEDKMRKCFRKQNRKKKDREQNENGKKTREQDLEVQI